MGLLCPIVPTRVKFKSDPFGRRFTKHGLGHGHLRIRRDSLVYVGLLWYGVKELTLRSYGATLPLHTQRRSTQ
jgi:hypothetical protein